MKKAVPNRRGFSRVSQKAAGSISSITLFPEYHVFVKRAHGIGSGDKKACRPVKKSASNEIGIEKFERCVRQSGPQRCPFALTVHPVGLMPGITVCPIEESPGVFKRMVSQGLFQLPCRPFNDERIMNDLVIKTGSPFQEKTLYPVGPPSPVTNPLAPVNIFSPHSIRVQGCGPDNLPYLPAQLRADALIGINRKDPRTLSKFCGTIFVCPLS
jgi:hypothetical protein